MVVRDRAQVKIWRMCISCCIPKARISQSECVMLIFFQLQQFLTQTCFNIILHIHYFTCFFSYTDILFIKSNNQMAVLCRTYKGYKMREMIYSQNLKIGNLEVDGILMLNWFIKKM
jgi:hypothetical protein